MRSPHFAALPFLALAIAGCMPEPGGYPSLLPRPIEKQGFAEPVRPAAVAAPDPALDARIAKLTTRLQSGNKRFAAAAQAAEAKVAVARGLREGSEPWLDAQLALSTLDSLRAPTLTVLAELESITSDRGVAGKPAAPALDAAVTAARAMAGAQGDRIAALEAALAGA